MCEIFIIDPQDEANSAEVIETNALDMYSKNPDGIGFVAIYREDGKFEYNVYKAPEYEGEAVGNFVRKNMDAWRMCVHARLATHGDDGVHQTHPIEADCPHCDIEMVVHNGVVSAESTWRETLQSEGHEFNTLVDSEVILHENSTVPTDIDDFEEPDLGGSLNYILFQEDAILMRSGYKYRDADHFVMGKRKRCEWEDDDRKKKYMLVTPDGEVQTKEASSTSGRSSSGSRRSQYTGSYTGSWWPNGDDSDSGGSRGGSRRSGRSRSGSSGGSGGGDSNLPAKAYEDWEDWPPSHLSDSQEAS